MEGKSGEEKKSKRKNPKILRAKREDIYFSDSVICLVSNMPVRAKKAYKNACHHTERANKLNITRGTLLTLRDVKLDGIYEKHRKLAVKELRKSLEKSLIKLTPKERENIDHIANKAVLEALEKNIHLGDALAKLIVEGYRGGNWDKLSDKEFEKLREV